MLFVQRFTSLISPTVTCVFLTLEKTRSMFRKYIQKTIAFGTCSHDTAANCQQRPAVSASELKEPSPKGKVGIENIKVEKKWDDDFINLEQKFEQSAQFMFCNVASGNNRLAPSKLRNHLQNKHAMYQNNFVQFL